MRSGLIRAGKACVGKALTSMGYSLVRRPDEGRLLGGDPRETAGTIFEILGPSGIGKTVLFRAVHSAARDNWFALGEIAGMHPSEIEETAELQPILSDLVLKRVEQEHARSKDAWTVVGAAGYASQAARTYMILRRPYTKGFMLDEGILHAFSYQLVGLDDPSLASLLDRHAIAFLDARRPETVAARFMERAPSRATRRGSARSRSFDEVTEWAAEVLAIQRKLYEAAIDLGCKGVRVLAEDGFESNVRDVLAFEATLRADLRVTASVSGNEFVASGLDRGTAIRRSPMGKPGLRQSAAARST